MGVEECLYGALSPAPAAHRPLRCLKSGKEQELRCEQETGSAALVADLSKDRLKCLPVYSAGLLNLQQVNEITETYFSQPVPVVSDHRVYDEVNDPISVIRNRNRRIPDKSALSITEYNVGGDWAFVEMRGKSGVKFDRDS